MDYLIHVLIMSLIMAILALSYKLQIGDAGIFSISQAAFYGIGAYTSSILAQKLHLTWILNLLLVMGFTALVSLILASCSIRIRSYYFIIASFGFQIIISNIFDNWTGLTGGPGGLKKIPPLDFIGFAISSRLIYLLITLILASLSIIIINKVIQSPFGRVLHALREDEVGVLSLGKDVFNFKFKILMLSGAIASIAGSLYAHYIQYISPESFTLEVSFFLMSIVLVGGKDSVAGVVVAAIVLYSFPEILRLIGFSGTTAAPLQQVFYGLLLILTLRFSSEGIGGFLKKLYQQARNVKGRYRKMGEQYGNNC